MFISFLPGDINKNIAKEKEISLKQNTQIWGGHSIYKKEKDELISKY